MIELGLDICDNAERRAQRQQANERRLINRCRTGENEIIGRLGLELPGTCLTGEGADQAVGVASAKEEGTGSCRGRQKESSHSKRNDKFSHGAPPFEIATLGAS